MAMALDEGEAMRSEVEVIKERRRVVGFNHHVENNDASGVQVAGAPVMIP